VVGRKAGSVEGYAYSPALKNSGVTWTREALDRWLENPQALVPGAKMFFALRDAQDRADVIAYLAEQK
jgi:cytochrome c